MADAFSQRRWYYDVKSVTSKTILYLFHILNFLMPAQGVGRSLVQIGREVHVI